VTGLVEYCQCLFPCAGGRSGVAAGKVRFAEPGESRRQERELAELPAYGDSYLVAGHRLAVAAEAVVSISDAVQCDGLAGTVAELAEQFRALLAVLKSPERFAELGVAPADDVQGGGLPAAVAGELIQPQRFPAVLERVAVFALPRARVGERGVGEGLTLMVSQLSLQVEGPIQVEEAIAV
jgi:hypothetical protein